MAAVRIGTSGWDYPHWVGPFYPPGQRPALRLEYYTRFFDTVELNRTFYRLPQPSVIDQWYGNTPRQFLFACKASRFITHMKKLGDPETATARFLAAVTQLENKLGPILFQLPPRWRLDAARLEAFLAALPSGYRIVFEFRDRSWFDPRAYAVLERHGAALCLYDLAGFQAPEVPTAAFTYVRLHGPAAAYCGEYGPAGLAGWADRIAGWAGQGQDVYAYFDNDQAGFATADASRLKRMLEGGWVGGRA